MESYFRNNAIFSLVNKWKIHLLIIAIVGAILGGVFSSPKFIKPKYSSYAVLFPANINPVSDESETEQMLEFLQSQDIRFELINAFNLSEHYGLSKEDKHYLTKMNKYLDGNLTFRQTPNEAVRINVMDKNPEIACAMVDSVIVFYNRMVLELTHGKSMELANAYRQQLNRLQIEMDSLGKILDKYRKENNMLDYKVQTKEYTRAIANGKTLAETRATLENWRNLGGDYVRTDSLLWGTMATYHEAKLEYETFYRDALKEITFAHVVTKPFVADKKSYPTRWLFVFFSALGAFFAGLLILIFIDKARISKS